MAMTEIEPHLRRIVSLHSSWADVKSRVSAAYGADYLPRAEELAFEMHGENWFPSQSTLIKRIIIFEKYWYSAKSKIYSEFGRNALDEAEIIGIKEKGYDWVFPPDELIERIVNNSSNWNTAEREVVKTLGDGYIEYASKYAKRIAGEQWVLDNNELSTKMQLKSTNEFAASYGSKSLLVLKLVAIFIIVALLFPPYHLVVQGNMDVDMGFKFIASPSTSSYTGVVNVSLLLCEFLVICIVGCIAFILARQRELHESK